MKITLWNNLLDPHGTEKSVTWDQLASWLAKPVEFIGKNETKGWSAATFLLEQRAKDKATAAYALCLDFDGTASRCELQAMFLGATYLAHASKSNTEASPRYRVILALSRPVTAAEYELLWSAYTREYADKVDTQTKDVSRFWYVPCRTTDTKYEHWRTDGTPIDVDTAIAVERALRDQEAREAAAKADRERHVQIKPSGSRLDASERASRYLATMDAAISGSAGHTALWRAACVLVRGFSLDRSTALALLEREYNPRCVPPWEPRDLAHKVDQAAGKCQKFEFGCLLNASRDQARAAIAQIPEPPPEDDYIPEPPEWLVEEPTQPAEAQESQPERQPEGAEAQPDSPPTAVQRYCLVSIQDLALSVLTDLNKPKDKHQCLSGVRELDEAIGGFRPSMVTVMAARTSFGKTTFAINVSEKSVAAGLNVLWMPFEDSQLVYGRRLVAGRARVNAAALRDRDINYKERQRIMRVIQAAETKPFMAPCIGKSVEWACQMLRDVSKEMKIHLVIGDYIQRMHTERRAQDRRNEVTLAVEMLTDAIKEVDAAGLLVSQLRRVKPGERPTMFDLKESGDIENCAEHIIMGWSEEVDDGTGSGGRKTIRKVFIEKNKDGPLTANDIEVPFDEVSAVFRPNEADVPPEYRDDLADIDSALSQ